MLRRHAAGVVISPAPLTYLVPVYKTNRTTSHDQYDMNALERIGLLKMDFLGLTTLTVLQDAVLMVEQNAGSGWTWKIWHWMMKPRTNFSRAANHGDFQFESHGSATFCGVTADTV